MQTMQKKEKSTGIFIFAVIVFLFSLFLLNAARTSYQAERRFIAEAVPHTAKVIEKKWVSAGRSSKPIVIYEYVVAHQTYTVEEELIDTGRNRFDRYKTDEMTDIYYLPEHPDQSRLVGNPKHYLSLLIGGLFTFGLAGIAIFSPELYPRWQKTVLEKRLVDMRLFAIHLLVLSVIGLFFGVYTHSAVKVLVWIFPAIMLGLAIYGIGHTQTMLKYISGSKTRRGRDISSRQIAFPEEFRYPIWSALQSASFERLGETVLGHNEITWCFHNPDYTITAEVVKQPNFEGVGFTTLFENKVVLETSFPIGEHFDTLSHYHRFSEQSPLAAFELHMQTIRLLQTTHGNPKTMETIQAFLDHEGFYREHYILGKYRRKISQHKAAILYWKYAFLFAIGFALLKQFVSLTVLWAYLIAGMSLGFVLCAIPGWIQNYKRIRQNHFYEELEHQFPLKKKHEEETA